MDTSPDTGARSTTELSAHDAAVSLITQALAGPQTPAGMPAGQGICDTRGMQKISPDALAREHLKRARSVPSGRSAQTVYGGHEHVLRQALMTLVKVAGAPGRAGRGRRAGGRTAAADCGVAG